MSRYDVILKRDDGGTETLASIKYYHDAMTFLRWRADSRTLFDERGRDDYKANIGLYNRDGEYSLFNSPSETLIDIENTAHLKRTKRDVATYILGTYANLDYAYPSPWADKIVQECENVFKWQRHELYGILSGGIVWYYPKISIFGMPAALTIQALQLLLWAYGGER